MSTTFSGASSDTLELLLDFCAAHPVPDIDAQRFLTRLNSGPDAIIDWRDRGVVAVLLDAVKGASEAIPLEIVGLVPHALNVEVARELLDEVAERTKKLGCPATELALSEIWAPHAGLAIERGYCRAYADLDMVCHDPNWGDAAKLPTGWSWHDVQPVWVDEYIRVLGAAFAGIAGTFLPSPAEIRRYLADPAIQARALVADGRALAVLRMTPARRYIHAIARDPAWRGAGLGRLAMDEARSCLLATAPWQGSLELTVVDTNAAAMELYRRCGFIVNREMTVLNRTLHPAG
ncbi:MAG: GNAT family N-acetyltransferase [Rhodospirillaceae bacterium]|nr:GNAT family N-acetyltransferase [Rhodospirillaceae bacterium]